MLPKTVGTIGAESGIQPLHHQRSASLRKALLCIVVIAICASSVRLLTYDRFLPYVDYVDEPHYVALADEIRGFSDQSSIRELYGLLSPLYVYTNVVVQTIHDIFKTNQWHIPGEYYYTLRLLSVFFGVCTALTIAWMGWQLGGRWAALISGLIWAFSPIVVEFNNLVIPDPMLYLVCALAVATSIAAWQRRSLMLLAFSLVCGIAAIYLKLWVVTAILPFVTVSIALTVREGRKMLPQIALLYGIAALAALHFLIILNPIESTHSVSAGVVEGTFFSNLTNINRIFNNLWYIAYPVDHGLRLSFIGLILGAAAYIYCQHKQLKVADSGSMWIIGIYLVSTWLLSAGISNVNIDSSGRMRHILPASVVFIPVWGYCLVLIARAGNHLLTNRNRNGARIVQIATVALVFFIFIQFAPGNINLINRFSRPHTINHLVNWFDSSPPHDGLVLFPWASKQESAWERIWGAYMGNKPYDRWTTRIDDIPLSMPEDYIARNIHWFVVSDADFARAEDLQRVQNYLQNLFLIKTITSQPGQNEGSGLYIYRFEHPGQDTNYLFGDRIRLIGYDLSTSVITSGDTIQLRPYWQLDHKLQQNLSIFVHLYSADAVESGTPVLLSQWDGELLPNGNRPTSTWDDLAEVYFGEPLELSIPTNLENGNYIVALGLYDYTSQQRLQGANGATFYEIPITISR